MLGQSASCPKIAILYRNPAVSSEAFTSEELLPEFLLEASGRVPSNRTVAIMCTVQHVGKVLRSKVHAANVAKLFHHVAQLLDAHAQRYRGQVHDTLPRKARSGALAVSAKGFGFITLARPVPLWLCIGWCRQLRRRLWWIRHSLRSLRTDSTSLPPRLGLPIHCQSVSNSAR